MAASLTGLREDHGQWGVDSLLLGVPPLAAWSCSPARRSRARGPSGLPRRGRRAALRGRRRCVAYGALKLDWALGGEFLLRETPLPPEARRDLLTREPAAVAGHWATAALAVTGIASRSRPCAHGACRGS